LDSLPRFFGFGVLERFRFLFPKGPSLAQSCRILARGLGLRTKAALAHPGKLLPRTLGLCLCSFFSHPQVFLRVPKRPSRVGFSFSRTGSPKSFPAQKHLLPSLIIPHVWIDSGLGDSVFRPFFWGRDGNLRALPHWLSNASVQTSQTAARGTKPVPRQFSSHRLYLLFTGFYPRPGPLRGLIFPAHQRCQCTDPKRHGETAPAFFPLCKTKAYSRRAPS